MTAIVPSASPEEASFRRLTQLAWTLVREAADLAVKGVITVAGWQIRSRQRTALRRLNDHMLKDIGVTRADAWREAAKPFWVP